MLQTAQRTEKKSKGKKKAPHERYLEAYRWMLQTRVFEDKLASLYRGGQITGGVYVGRGQEAVSAACGMFLQKGDIFAPLIRDQAGRSAFGEPLIDVARTYLGSRQGPMRGRDGNIHRGKPGEGQLAMISHLGAMISVTVGVLLAKKFKGEKGFVGLTTIGEGGMQSGATHEGNEHRGGRASSARLGRDEQSLRVFDAERPRVCLRRFGGSREGIWI